MSIHAQVRAALAGLAGDRVYPLIAEENTATPYIVFQVVGGEPENFASGDRPAKRWRRVQVNVWSKSILEAGAIADQVENALCAVAELQTDVVTGAVDTYDEATKYRGQMQDFMLFC